MYYNEIINDTGFKGTVSEDSEDGRKWGRQNMEKETISIYTIAKEAGVSWRHG